MHQIGLSGMMPEPSRRLGRTYRAVLAAVHRGSVSYAAVHGMKNSQPKQRVERLVASMLAAFMRGDTEFAKGWRKPEVR